MVPEICSTTEFYVIFCHFLPFYPSNDPGNQSFEKKKKKPEDILILQMCTINDNHMIFGSDITIF